MAAQLAPSRPYPGIEAFGYADHPVFFARAEEAEKLLRSVTVYRSVLLFGGSGAGKSSLINAGFVPLALSDGFIPERIRLQPRPGQEIIIERIALHVENEPPYLPSCLASEENAATRQVLSIDDFRARIAARQLNNRVPVLIFDQFEEIISLFEEAPRGDSRLAARKVQADLTDLLVSLHRNGDLPIKLLFVFREDYLAKLGKVFNRCPDVRDTFVRIAAPRAAALEQIILGPFRRFPGRFPNAIPETLAKRLQVALEERSDSSEVNLSEVQIVCLRLWLSTDQEREFAQKGLQGLLEDYLAESLGRMPPDLRDPAVALLSRLVTAEGLRNVISEEDLIARVLNEEHIRREKAEPALASLVTETRLVRRVRREDVVFFEIVSEFLAPWIRRQKAARRLRALRRRWTVAAAVLLLIAIASVGATIWVLRERTESAIARDEVRKARAVENKARLDAQVAQRARIEAEDKLAVALSDRTAAMAALEEARKTLSQVRPQLVLQTKLEELTKEAQQLRAENAKLTRDVAALRQTLQSVRGAPLVRSPVLAGIVHPGELTVFTGGPFESGIACFIMETDRENSIYTGIVVVALADGGDTWKGNMRKASEFLRRSAGQIFRSPASAVSKRLQSLKRDLRLILPGIATISTGLTSRTTSGDSYRTSFPFESINYEVHLQRGPREFQLSVFAVGSNPR